MHSILAGIYVDVVVIEKTHNNDLLATPRKRKSIKKRRARKWDWLLLDMTMS